MQSEFFPKNDKKRSLRNISIFLMANHTFGWLQRYTLVTQ